MTTSETQHNVQTEERRDLDYGRRSNWQQDYGRRERGIFISTEARPGFVTTEFWFTLIGVIALGILAYASDALGVRWGMGFATAVLVAYVVSRGLAKAGSSDILKTGSRNDR
jgi:hypothetical protein